MFKRTRSLHKELLIQIPIWKIIVFVIGTIALSFGIGMIFKMIWIGRILLTGFYFILFAGIFYWIMYANNEKKKYSDLTVYMEQLICSFKRSGNVSMSLEDCLELFSPEERMYQVLGKAIKRRKTGEGVELGKSLTEMAFAEIENVFKSRRLILLHNYIKKAEKIGGDWDHALDLQLNDTQEWKKRTRKFHAKRNNIKLEVFIATILSGLLCYSTVLMTPADLNIDLSVSASYQVVTLLAFMGFGLILFFTQKMLSGTWLDSKTINEKHDRIMQHRYEFVLNHSKKLDDIIENLPLIIIGLLLTTVLLVGSSLFLSGIFQIIGLLGAGLLIFYVLYSCVTTKKRYIKSVSREVEKEFPYFLLGVTLLLQTESMYNAIKISAQDMNGIMKTELDKMLKHLYEEPNSIHAFSNFFKEFNVEETKSGMKVLYSISINGYEGMERQLDFLAEQNNELMGQAEEIRFSNQVAGLGLVKQLPMLIGVGKMMVDLIGVIGAVTATMSNFA